MSHASSPARPGPETAVAADGSLHHAFAALAQALPLGEDLPAVLEDLAALAVSMVGACDAASVSLLDQRKGMTTPAASTAVVVELDAEQARSGQGPCWEAVTGESHAVYSAELAADARWPHFGRVATARGFGSILSRRFDAGGPVGGINFYARRTNAFGDEDKAAASLLAAFAGMATALVHERVQAAQLHIALQGRDVIGQAKGILMERERITADEAFDRLRRASQHLNRKLRDIAEHLAATGEAPALY
jgi:hypothetical protein